jgi:hypothetical protein
MGGIEKVINTLKYHSQKNRTIKSWKLNYIILEITVIECSMLKH